MSELPFPVLLLISSFYCFLLPRHSDLISLAFQPIFLNEVLTRVPTDASVEEPVFHLSHIENVYTLRTDNVNERTAWMNKIKEAAELYIDTEKKKREKAYQR